MKLLLDQFFSSRKVVTFKDVKIYHETDSAILVELKDHTVWLPKKKVKVNKQKNLATITIPLNFIRKKFPSKKYKQFAQY